MTFQVIYIFFTNLHLVYNYYTPHQLRKITISSFFKMATAPNLDHAVCLIYTYLVISLCDLLSCIQRNKCIILLGNERSYLGHIILMSFAVESVNGENVYYIRK